MVIFTIKISNISILLDPKYTFVLETFHKNRISQKLKEDCLKNVGGGRF